MNTYVNQYYDVFISYRHQSGFYMANLIYEKLVYNGYQVFLDKKLRSDKEGYASQIEAAIRKSKNFIMVLFNGDLNESIKKGDWLLKEAKWALSSPGTHLIPALCEGFSTKPEDLPDLPPELTELIQKHGIVLHKDNSFDSNFDDLCRLFLKNTNPVMPSINTKDFFEKNIHQPELTIKKVDMAFLGGDAWRKPGQNKLILDEILKMNVPVRIIIGEPESAEMIAQHMRDGDSELTSFEQLQISWKKYCAGHPGLIEVRKSLIPLLHIFHAIEYMPSGEEKTSIYDRIHVKYYAYQNINVNDSFEHEMSSYSKYYQMYKTEFEYLWNQSEALE